MSRNDCDHKGCVSGLNLCHFMILNGVISVLKDGYMNTVVIALLKKTPLVDPNI